VLQKLGRWAPTSCSCVRPICYREVTKLIVQHNAKLKVKANCSFYLNIHPYSQCKQPSCRPTCRGLSFLAAKRSEASLCTRTPAFSVSHTFIRFRISLLILPRGYFIPVFRASLLSGASSERETQSGVNRFK